MAKQTFTTGQVLTAAQMTSLQQTAMLGGAASAKTASYTLVAADAGTAISMSNASATTITVNTALFAAGDTVQITNLGAGVCTITAGTATVNTSASLALAQYESGTLNFTSTSAAIFIKGAGGAAGGGMTLLSTTTLSGATTTVSSIDQTYVNLFILVLGVNKSNANYLYCKPLNSSTNTSGNYIGTNNSGVFEGTANLNDRIRLASRNHMVASNTNNAWAVIINNYASASFYKPFSVNGTYRDDTGFDTAMGGSGGILTTSAINSLVFDPAAGTFNGGTVLIYGVK